MKELKSIIFKTYFNVKFAECLRLNNDFITSTLSMQNAENFTFDKYDKNMDDSSLL